ncbi:hypothetical protein BDZ45DRAFT_595553, partial [Acephala macrosclerotiorum]
LWGRSDAEVMSTFASKYKPAPVASNPTFTPKEDVSVIIPALSPPAEFKACLQRIFENDPLEIIIVTTEEHLEKVTKLVNEVVSHNGLDLSKVILVTSKQGARVQYRAGVEKAKGSIIAKCDDHVFWSRHFLTHMLACFEDPNVGAACPSVKVHIPYERRHPDEITVWEVAGTKLVSRGPGSATSMHVAAKWMWICGGCTALYRATILQDPKFLNAYTNDYWLGRKLDCGEDTFVSRWLLKNNWVIATQWSKETTAWRTVKRSPAFINQMLRWERSTIQSFIRTTYEVPRVWKNFFVARKTIERILKAPFAILHIVAWWYSLKAHPVKTLLLLAWYMKSIFPGYWTFFNEYPYMTRHWWAAVLVDLSYVVIGPWAWLTLWDTTWERGEGGWTQRAVEDRLLDHAMYH